MRSRVRGFLEKGNPESLPPRLLCLQNYRTVLDKLVRQDLQNGEGLDVGSISDLINLGLGFGETPEHFISWLPSISEEGISGSESAVHLMKSISDFADRMYPAPNI